VHNSSSEDSCSSHAPRSTDKGLLNIAHTLCALKKILASDLGHFEREFTYRAGLEAANCYFERNPDNLSDKTEAEVLENLLTAFATEGMGTFAIDSFDTGNRTLEISCPDSIEAIGFIQHGEHKTDPTCSFLSGFLAGVGKHVFGGPGVGTSGEIISIESSCASQGKEKCRFVIGSRARLKELGHQIAPAEEASLERTLKLNEEILSRNLDLQNLNLELERMMRRRGEELRRSERNYQSLVNLSSDPIIICASDGLIKTANEAALDMLGYDNPDELEGVSISSLLLDGENAWERCVWLIEKEGVLKNQVFQLVGRGGGKIIGEVSARFADIRSERHIHMVIRDATERNALRDRMEQAMSDRKFFNDLLANNIMNHMTTAMHFLEKSCKSDNLPEDDRRALKIVNKDIAGAYALASVVRDLSRVDSLGESEFGEAMDICTVLADAVQEAERIHCGRKITIRFDRPEKSCYAMANSLLGRMFFNLIANAVKFDSSEEVFLDLAIDETEHKDAGFWCIRLSDRGRGIPDHEKEKVFERYYRGDPTIPGAGLGLHVVRRIAKACGGFVWAENRVPEDFSKGTTMVVMLKKAGDKSQRLLQMHQAR
jgi:PAS domain S-box-containing protein